MNTKIAKLAAAAMILVGVFAGYEIFTGTSSVSWAEVRERVAAIRAVVYTAEVTQSGETMRIEGVQSGDYGSRMEQGIPMGHPYLPLSRRILDKVEAFAQEHPLLATGIGTLALHRLGKTRPLQFLGKTVIPKATDVAQRGMSSVKDRASAAMKALAGGETKLSAYMEDLIPEPTDTVMLPEVDIDKVAERVGFLIVEG